MSPLMAGSSALQAHSYISTDPSTACNSRGSYIALSPPVVIRQVWHRHRGQRSARCASACQQPASGLLGWLQCARHDHGDHTHFCLFRGPAGKARAQELAFGPALRVSPGWRGDGRRGLCGQSGPGGPVRRRRTGSSLVWTHAAGCGLPHWRQRAHRRQPGSQLTATVARLTASSPPGCAAAG